ncbi:cell number regulator 2 [Ziziphus jujuba]|uniref:Cell number regulator 2 n=1 Tax=Ziziphus jujuba TaxID=326968 RepID=A0ABM3IKX5_ZIZJJ|nr:cell number regulator 2 [Ziziphus jujuba]
MDPTGSDTKLVAHANGSQPPPGQWTTGLFACYEDPSSCFMTWLVPFVTFGQRAEILDRGNMSCCVAGTKYFCSCCCAYSLSKHYRTKLRAVYSLPEEPCSDCCVHFWCLGFANCQEYRELKNRGIDPSAGWKANAEKMKQSGASAPPHIAPGMRR